MVWFSRERRVDAIEMGQRALRSELSRTATGWRRVMTGTEITSVAHDINYGHVQAMYQAVGEGHLEELKVVNHLIGRLSDEDQGSARPRFQTHC